MPPRRGGGGGANKKSAPTAAPTEPRPVTSTRPPPSYDPFETAAPVQPQAYMSSSNFRYDDFVTQRRYARCNLHGESERRFDPEQHEPSEQYLSRLQAQPFDSYIDHDTLIDEERQAVLVQQPPEAIAALQHDLRNERFINAIRGPITRSAQPSQELQRRRELARTSAQRVHEIEQAFSVAEGNNPDFFTRLSGYEIVRRNARRQQQNPDTALLKALDDEIAQLAENDDGENSDDATRKQRRDELEKEKQEIEAAQQHDDAAEDEEEEHASDEVEAIIVPVIGEHEASQLLEPNPLMTLHSAMRTHFLQLPEPATLWQMLYPLVLQHEKHRRHYNIVELVRAMALRGAKYDGCVKVRVRRRLGAIVDRTFYAPFFGENNELIDGHEHSTRAGTSALQTTLVVFKFFLVRRSKINNEIMTTKNNSTSTASTAAANTELTDNNATNIDSRLDVHTRHMHLNKAGLYDADEAYDAGEDDGTDEYGSMHDIKYLEREFMFSMRLVCVEATDATAADEDTGYASLDDNDFVLPRDSNVENGGAAQSVWSINNDRTDTTARLQHAASTTTTSRAHPSSQTSSAFSRARDDANDMPVESNAEDAVLFTHSDDEENEREQSDMRQDVNFMPTDSLVLTLDQAAHLVGKWKAAAFMQRVNSHSIGPLCVRSFMFYAGSKQ